MHKKNIFILTLTIIITLLFSSCFLQKDNVTEPKPEPFSEEKANETALSYLRDKYGEEFVAKGGTSRTDSIAFGNTWYVSMVIKKTDEEDGDPHIYEVSISKENNYTVLGDTVMLEYYEKLYNSFAKSIVEKEMGDIPFELVITSELPNDSYDSSLYGVIAETEIPNSLEDENSIFLKKDFSFDIFIPKSSDNENIPVICKNIKSNIKEDYRRAYVAVLEDDDFQRLMASKDKYWKCVKQNYFLGKKIYEVR